MERFRLFSWRVRYAVFAVFSTAAVTAVVARPSFASDHEDAPSLQTDPGADIADVFTFMRPGGSSHLVLSMTVHPNATMTTTFETNIEYQFRILGYDDVGQAIDPTVDTRVTCRFQAPDTAGKQLVLCDANGTSAYATVGTLGTADANGPMRIYAGLRADPAFGDIGALKSTLANKHLDLKDAGGTNTFANQNVLAIVVEVDIDKVLLAGLDGGSRPKLAISGTTERL